MCHAAWIYGIKLGILGGHESLALASICLVIYDVAWMQLGDLDDALLNVPGLPDGFQ